MKFSKSKVAIYNCTLSEEVNSLQISLLTELVNSVDEWSFNEDRDVYSDVGVSKLTIEGRPALSELLTKARNGQYNLIVLKNITSLVRSASVYMKLSTEMAEMGVGFCFLDNGFTTFDMMERGFGMFVLSNEEHRNESNPKDKHILGFKLNEAGKYELDAESVPLVAQIFMSVFVGEDLNKICFDLEFSGCINPRGEECWTPDILVEILRNPDYRENISSDKDSLGFISAEVWDMVQMIIDRK